MYRVYYRHNDTWQTGYIEDEEKNLNYDEIESFFKMTNRSFMYITRYENGEQVKVEQARPEHKDEYVKEAD